jgi:hypothetical protein
MEVLHNCEAPIDSDSFNMVVSNSQHSPSHQSTMACTRYEEIFYCKSFRVL